MVDNETPYGVCNSYPCQCNPLDYIDDKPECYKHFDFKGITCDGCYIRLDCEETSKEEEK